MSAVISSSELVKLLVDKARDASAGKNLQGVDGLCRVTETMIKLARLEMDYAKIPLNGGQAPMLAAPSRWTPLDVSSIAGLDESYLKAAVKAGETHLSAVEDSIDRISEDTPKHPGIKVLSTEATYLRAYLLMLRDEIGSDKP